MFTDKKIMAPLWIAYPEYDRYSAGWRSGTGQQYKEKFTHWYASLDEEEKACYQQLFPRPVIWSGYWENKDTCDIVCAGSMAIEKWSSDMRPAYTPENIMNSISSGEKVEFHPFYGHKPSADSTVTDSCLSQWWMCDFTFLGKKFCCMEQFMMAHKAMAFGDKEMLIEIMAETDPKEMKALGRRVRNFDSGVWSRIGYTIVLNGNYYKFSQNPELMDFLLSTGDKIIVEASPRDKIWGIGMGKNNPDAHNPDKWRGRNLLGFALTEVRDEIRRVWRNAYLCTTGIE